MTVTWHDDLESAIADRELKGPFVLGKGEEGAVQYAAMPMQEVGDYVRAHADEILYEVVLEGQCYVHFCLQTEDGSADLNVMMSQLCDAVELTMADVKELEGALPQTSYGVIDGRIVIQAVYRELACPSLASCAAIAEAVSTCISSNAERYHAIQGALRQDVYKQGHLNRIACQRER